jgi:hypothetical protein
MDELSLIDEVVLLSLAGSSRAVRRAVAVACRAYPAMPATVKGARASLVARGMLGASARFRPAVPTDTAELSARQARVVAVVNTPTPPVGRDAEILTLLAFAGSLPFTRHEMHFAARLRIGEIGARSVLPPVVRELMSELDVETTHELAGKLVPFSRYSKEGAYDPGFTTASGGAYHTGGH